MPRSGLFKKALELTVLCDAKVSIIMTCTTNKLHEFISPNTDAKQRKIPNLRENNQLCHGVFSFKEGLLKVWGHCKCLILFLWGTSTFRRGGMGRKSSSNQESARKCRLMLSVPKNAKSALLSGCSAGGLTTILHCDSFHDMLPSANVKCFSDAGYFIDGTDVSGGSTIEQVFNQVVAFHQSAKNLTASCTSKFKPGQGSGPPRFGQLSWQQWRLIGQWQGVGC